MIYNFHNEFYQLNAGFEVDSADRISCGPCITNISQQKNLTIKNEVILLDLEHRLPLNLPVEAEKVHRVAVISQH